MKIAITAVGTDLSAQVDPRFGRCPFFIIIDPDSEKHEVIENPNVQAMGGAGIQSAQLIASKGAEVVLTGSCGPNAYQTLSAAGVTVITGISGTVGDALAGFKSGKFQSTTAPNVGAHFGTGYGMGRGMRGGRGGGKGMGRGMGMGMGMGMGKGMVQGTGGSSPFAKGQTSGVMPQDMDEKKGLDYLKKKAELLRKQVEDITKKIEELEKKE
jgi:predicted Fe-Mo cluster-binding NifX family protein